MELIELSLCRLCARNKFPNEIIGRLDDETLEIKPKLIACCQWNTHSEIESEKLPQKVCVECFQSLQQCWDFAEQTRRAHYELLSKFPGKIEPKVELDNIHDNFVNQSLKSDDSDIDELLTNLENDDQLSAPFDDEHFYETDFDVTDSHENFTKLEETCIIEQHELGTIKDAKLDVETENIKIESPFNGRKFLDAILPNERNSDGTVKPEAIQRLGLENWTIVQYRCYLCKLRLSDRYDWRNHLTVEHPGYPKRYLCNICNVKDYCTRKPMLRHIMNQHLRHLKHCCTKCSTYYWDVARLRSHSVRCKPEMIKSSLCDICGKECKSESVLRVHRRSHLTESRRIYECYMCRKSGLSKNNVKYHMLMVHINEKPAYKCEHCGKEFGRKEQCTRHVKTHINEFPFECPHCAKKFRFKVGLQTHIRTHTGDRPYQCILCPYRCADSGNLVKHMRQKHGVTKTQVLKRQSMQ